MPKVIIYTPTHNIEDILMSDTFILLYFTASWCGPCKKISPVIHDKFTKINNLSIYKIDIEDNDEICEKYSIKSVPHFLLFKGGEKKLEYSGSDSIKLLNGIKDKFINN